MEPSWEIGRSAFVAAYGGSLNSMDVLASTTAVSTTKESLLTNISPYISLFAFVVSLFAIGLSLAAFLHTRRTRKADIYSERNEELRKLGVEMERVGEWIDGIAPGKSRDELTEKDIRHEYRSFLEAIRKLGKNPKEDPLELARREVKTWFLKCWRSYYSDKDLTLRQLQHLLTDSRTRLMWHSFIMTREQHDEWNRFDHDPTSRNSPDEPDFIALACAGFKPRGRLSNAVSSSASIRRET